MRQILLCVGVVLSFALTLRADKPEEARAKETARLEGTWRLVAIKHLLAPDHVMQKKGKDWRTGPGLEAAERQDYKDVFYTFKGDKLTVKRPAKFAKSPHIHSNCTFKFDLALSPKGIDLDCLPADYGRPLRAIYLLDGDDLWICDYEGNDQRPTNFDLSVGISYPKRIYVLRRVEASKIK